jgi:hypothetical protein
VRDLPIRLDHAARGRLALRQIALTHVENRSDPVTLSLSKRGSHDRQPAGNGTRASTSSA